LESPAYETKEWEAADVGGRWPFLVGFYDSLPFPKWIRFSLIPAILESGFFVGALSLALVVWGFGLHIEVGFPSILALAGSLLSLQFLWHLLHIPPFDILTLRWKVAFKNKRGKITAGSILVVPLVLFWAAVDDWSSAGTILVLMFGLVLPHTVGNMSEQRRLTLERRGTLLAKVDEVKAQEGQVVEELSGLLDDEDRYVREASVIALSEIGTSEALARLILALDDDDWHVRETGVRTLGEIGGSATLSGLIMALEDENEHVQAAAGEMLANSEYSRAIETLKNAARHRSATVRAISIGIHGRIGDERGFLALLTAMKDDDYEVIASAAWELGKIGNPRAVPALIVPLKNRSSGSNNDDAGFGADAYPRAVAADALGKIGDERAVDPLITMLGERWWPDSPEENMPCVAAKALLDIGSSRGVDAVLIQMWNYKEPWPGKRPEQMVRALKDVGGSAMSRAAHNARGAFGHQDKEVRRLAARALGIVGSRDDIGVLHAALADQDKDVRSAVVEALGKIADARSVEPLKSRLRDKEKGVRDAALAALGKIDDSRAKEAGTATCSSSRNSV